MKKIILPVLLVCFLYSCKTVETAIKEAEVSAGAGKSDMKGGSYVDPIGAQVCIEAKIIEVNKNSSFKAGVGYTLQGADYVDPDYTGTVRTSYIILPLLYSYEWNQGLYAEVGLQPSFLLSAKDKGKTSSGFEYNEDYKSSLNALDIGVPVGAGYRFKNGFGLGIRATYGLIKVEKDNTEPVHNLLIVGMLKYRFNVRSKK